MVEGAVELDVVLLVVDEVVVVVLDGTIDVVVLEVVVELVVLEVVVVLIVDVVLLEVVVGSEDNPVNVIRPTTIRSAANTPVSVAPLVTCSVASGAQTRPETSALRETEKRAPRENRTRSLGARSSPGPSRAFGPIDTSPETKTCDAESASITEPRRARRLQNV